MDDQINHEPEDLHIVIDVRNLTSLAYYHLMNDTVYNSAMIKALVLEPHESGYQRKRNELGRDMATGKQSFHHYDPLKDYT